MGEALAILPPIVAQFLIGNDANRSRNESKSGQFLTNTDFASS